MAHFNPEDETIKIPFSKYKLIGFLLMGLSFLAAGILFVIDPSEIANSGLRHKSVLFVIAIGATAIVSSGAACIFFLYKLMSLKPGLIIDINGIYDNSSLFH